MSVHTYFRMGFIWFVCNATAMYVNILICICGTTLSYFCRVKCRSEASGLSFVTKQFQQKTFVCLISSSTIFPINTFNSNRTAPHLHICLDSALLRVTYHYVISFPTIFISRRYYAMFVSLISAISHALMTEIVDYFINSTPPLPFENLGTWHFGSGPIFWSSLACRKPLFKFLIFKGESP